MDTGKTENSKDKADKAEGTEFSCNPQDFKGMFEMMGKCCSAPDEMSDCSAMMKSMMANCCKSKIKCNTS